MKIDPFPNHILGVAQDIIGTGGLPLRAGQQSPP